MTTGPQTCIFVKLAMVLVSSHRGKSNCFESFVTVIGTIDGGVERKAAQILSINGVGQGCTYQASYQGRNWIFLCTTQESQKCSTQASAYEAQSSC